MADILPFKKTVKPATRQKSTTLCREGHHKWKIMTERKFDVKQGRLVTVLSCSRCGKRKIKAL